MTIVLHRPEARFHVEPLCWQLPESEIAKPPPDGAGIVLPLAAYCAQVDQWHSKENRTSEQEIVSVESGHGDSDIFECAQTAPGGRDGRKQAKVCASLSVHSMQSGPFHRGGGHGRLAASHRSVKEDNALGAGVNRNLRAAHSSLNPAVGRAPASRSVSRHARLRCGLGGPARAGFGVSTWTDVGPAEFPWFQPLARVIIVARD